jgi:tetratricopeptide (TPR) repeat protein
MAWESAHFMACLLLERSCLRLRALFLLMLMIGAPSIAHAQMSDSPLASRTAPALSAEMNQAMEWLELRSLSRAQDLIEASLNENPRSPIWRFLKATLLAELGQDAEAIAALEAFVSEFPELAEPYNNLAVLYLRVGQAQKAREALERALLNRPGYSLAHENLGDLYAALALQSYERGLATRQPSALMRAKQQHLQALPKAAPLRLTPRFPQTERTPQ